MPAPTSTPPTQRLAHALDHSAPLAKLLALLADSRQALQTVSSALPEELRSVVQPGPLEGTQWTLLVPHASAAAKLRQCLPTLNTCLAQSGRTGWTIRVKVLQPR